MASHTAGQVCSSQIELAAYRVPVDADVKAEEGVARPRHRWKFPKSPAALRQQETQSIAATSSAACKAAAKIAAHVLDEWSSDEEDQHEEAASIQKLSAKRSADGRFAAADGRRQTNGEQHGASSSGCSGGGAASRADAEAGSLGGPDEARAAAMAATMVGPQRLAKLTANARLSSGQSRTAHKRTGGGGAPGLKPSEPGRFSPVQLSQPTSTANTCLR